MTYYSETILNVKKMRVKLDLPIKEQKESEGAIPNHTNRSMFRSELDALGGDDLGELCQTSLDFFRANENLDFTHMVLFYLTEGNRYRIVCYHHDLSNIEPSDRWARIAERKKQEVTFKSIDIGPEAPESILTHHGKHVPDPQYVTTALDSTHENRLLPFLCAPDLFLLPMYAGRRYVGAAGFFDMTQGERRPRQETIHTRLTLADYCSVLGGYVRNIIRMNKSRKRAETDKLTGLPNRTALERYMQHVIEGVNGGGGSAALIFMDTDHFKSINDRHGEPTGDTVLTSVAREAQKVLRESAYVARPGSKEPVDVARLGGEEFIIIIHNADRTDAYIICQRIREHIQNKRFQYEDAAPCGTLTASLGFTVYEDDVPELTKIRASLTDSDTTVLAERRPSNEDSIAKLIYLADRAAKRAKAAGRNTVSASMIEPIIAKEITEPTQCRIHMFPNTQRVINRENASTGAKTGIEDAINGLVEYLIEEIYKIPQAVADQIRTMYKKDNLIEFQDVATSAAYIEISKRMLQIERYAILLYRSMQPGATPARTSDSREITHHTLLNGITKLSETDNLAEEMAKEALKRDCLDLVPLNGYHVMYIQPTSSSGDQTTAMKETFRYLLRQTRGEKLTAEHVRSLRSQRVSPPAQHVCSYHPDYIRVLLATTDTEVARERAYEFRDGILDLGNVSDVHIGMAEYNPIHGRGPAYGIAKSALEKAVSGSPNQIWFGKSVPPNSTEANVDPLKNPRKK